jgi:hypothetical protein
MSIITMTKIKEINVNESFSKHGGDEIYIRNFSTENWKENNGG